MFGKQDELAAVLATASWTVYSKSQEISNDYT